MVSVSQVLKAEGEGKKRAVSEGEGGCARMIFFCPGGAEGGGGGPSVGGDVCRGFEAGSSETLVGLV